MVKPKLSEQTGKFLREVGIIVLGVLIALFFGEIADVVRWKDRVGSSMEAIRQEMSGNRYNVVERLSYQPCVESRLAAIGRVLQQARTTGTMPEVQNIGTVGMRLTEQYAYEVARSEGAPLHMDSAQARDLAKRYGAFTSYVSVTEAERQNWTILSTIETTSGPISDDLLDDLLQAWSAAKGQAAWVGLISRQIDERLDALNIPVEFTSAAPNRAALIRQSRMRPLCQPMVVREHPVARTPLAAAS